MEKINQINEEKRIQIYLIIIEVIFVLTAVSFILIFGDSLFLGSFEKFDNDDVKYIRSAWNLIDNKILSYENISESTAYIMPGLTLVLSFFMFIFGKLNGIIAFKIFQVMLQAVSIYLLFLISKKVFNSKIALIACLNVITASAVFNASSNLNAISFCPGPTSW